MERNVLGCGSRKIRKKTMEVFHKQGGYAGYGNRHEASVELRRGII